MRDRQQALQRTSEGRVDPLPLDNPDCGGRTLEALIQRRLLLDRAVRAGVTVRDERLKDLIGKQQVFQDETGQFSPARYEQYLKSEGMTPAMFEARLRNDIALRQFADGYADSTFVPRAVVERLTRLSGQRRELSQYVLSAEKFIKQVKLDADAAKQYYDANPAEFRIPEQVRVEDPGAIHRVAPATGTARPG